VSFLLGKTVLGSVAGQEKLSVVDIVENAVDETDSTVTNIARLLQSLDEDNNLDNGIAISQTIRSAFAEVELSVTKSITAFENSLGLTSLLASLNVSLVSTADAQSHIRSSVIENIVAGTYAGTYGGDDTGTWQVSVNSSGEIAGTGNSDMVGSFTITGQMSNSYGATMLASGSAFQGLIGGTYTVTFTSDGRITGSWVDPQYGMSGSVSGSKTN
ncbi:hypothetical protein ACFLZV_06750, partial [Candidatus Margulisiibacteriota bacterium]